MQADSISRRHFFSLAGVGATGLSAGIELSSDLVAAEPAAIPRAGGGKLNVLCVGAHPDDPESGCAGTLTRYAEAGHSVTIVYLTRGERGIRDKGLDEAARIRSAECEAACKIIGAKALFFGQIDGATEVTKAHVDAMTRLLSS